MSQFEIKSHYSAAELAQLRIPGIPTSRDNVRLLAERECWPYREARGRGGVRHEYAPPAHIAAEIKHRAARQLVAAAPRADHSQEVALPEQPQLLETDSQRLTADARKGILTTLDRLMAQCHISREAAMTTVLTQAKAGTLDDHMVMMLKAARDGRGRKGDGFPSVRTLKRWLAQGKTGDLVPKKVQADYSIPEWARAFLPYYQQPQKPSVELAYREFNSAFRMRERSWDMPTIHQVRRFLGKLGNVTREVGRMGPRELKNIRPHKRRTFAELQPNDVWSADGHTFDAEVQHPLHGRPFRPEVTSIIDIATRKIVGFSLGLAESSFVVLEAISNAVLSCGAPGIFYVDNGSGYKNHLLKREGTGLQGLLGFEVSHSLPYNSQAKGVIERSHQTLWIQAAKLLPGFVGADMDGEARLARFKLTRNAVRNGGATHLLGWEDFVRFCAERVSEYNARPHRSLPKFTDPQTGRTRHMSPNDAVEVHRSKGWEPVLLDEHDRERVFRPRIQRTVTRGEVTLFNNKYFSELLTEFNGDPVHVAYDLHDAQRVWVHHLDGRLICKAELGANATPFFGMSVIEQAREKRADARVKRLEARLDEVEAERRGAPALTIETPEVITIPGFGQITRESLDARVIDMPTTDVVVEAHDANAIPTATVHEIPETAEQRYGRWKGFHQRVTNEEALTEAEMNQYEMYQRSKEFAAQLRREKEGGESELAAYKERF